MISPRLGAKCGADFLERTFDAGCSGRYTRRGLVSTQLVNSKSLSSAAQRAMDEAVAAGDPIYIPSISLVEVVYLVEKGKLPAVVLDRLTNALSEPDSGFVIAPLNLSVALNILQVSRATVPDMPDRIIAAQRWI